jgi:hypothetical protein
MERSLDGMLSGTSPGTSKLTWQVLDTSSPETHSPLHMKIVTAEFCGALEVHAEVEM